ncbi:MAG: protein-L-isoaspartate(D-aspartate) O-methyltransferase [Gemmatimonadota bacterium]|nr:MAG: protein-L-isoaspartate(D-aspartate) O-methyltransferase [Gemmatimonadota bacterium]
MNVHQERRRQLIEQLRASGIRDLTVLHAFDRVPRHLFVPEAFEARAYLDEALPLGHGQTISRPSTHALYLQALRLEGDERLLEIGTGSGFQTALLATLCRQVFSIERVPELAARARARIEALGFTNVVIRAGDGSHGWRRYSPYDGILVTAGAKEVPSPLLRQLRVGGQLLIPIGDRQSQELHRIVRSGEETMEDEVIARVRFVALHGLGGLEVQDEQVSKW